MSRLDRLFGLIEKGSSPATRKTAAEQIGDVVRGQPACLPQVLDRLRPLLGHKAWDTRVAAGQALSAVADGVPAWDPSTVAAARGPPLVPADGGGESPMLQFAEFDFRAVRQRSKVLGAGGIDFEDDHELDPRERLSQQRRNIRTRLGLFEEGDNLNDIVDDADIMAATQTAQAPSKPEIADIVAELEKKKGKLSARERNQAKRRARQLAKEKGGGRHRHLPDPQPPPPSDRKRKSTTASVSSAAPPASTAATASQSSATTMPTVIPPVAQQPYPSEPESPGYLPRNTSYGSFAHQQPTSILGPQGPLFPELARAESHDNLMGLARVSSSQNLDELKRNHSKTNLAAAAASAASAASAPAPAPAPAPESSKRAKIDRVVVESKAQPEDDDMASDEWPFAILCDDLCHDLFNSRWEVRHGAGLGLRHILKRHGTGAGKVPGMSAEAMAAANMAWLEDLAVRLVCVFVLDRFCDFVSDSVTAPVRETCAMTLAAVLPHMSSDLVTRVCGVLLDMLSDESWEMRHVSMLGIRYMIAVRSDLADALLQRILPPVIASLSDDDDDVRGVAAASLQPVSALLVRQNATAAAQVTVNLWERVRTSQELAASTASVMALLADMYSLPEADLAPVLAQANLDLTHLVPSLLPLMAHSIFSVRKSALTTLHKLLTSSGAPVWAPRILPVVLDRLFTNIFVEARPELVTQTLDNWAAALAVSEPQTVAAAVQRPLKSWLGFLSAPPRPSAGPGGTVSAPAPTDTPEVLLGLAITGSTALGRLAKHLTPDAFQTLCAYARELSSSAYGRDRRAAALVVRELCKCDGALAAAVPQDLSDLFLAHLCDAAPPVFADLAQVQRRLRADATSLLKVWIGAIPAASVRQYANRTLTHVEATHLATAELAAAQGALHEVLGAQKYAELVGLANQLQASAVYMARMQDVLSSAVATCEASALVYLQRLPAKLNPILRSLMRTVKQETVVALQKLAADSVAALLQLCVARTPSPNDKVIKNLLALTGADKTRSPQADLGAAVPDKAMSYEAVLMDQEPPQDKAAAELGRLSQRGSTWALQSTVRQFGPAMFEQVPKLWSATGGWLTSPPPPPDGASEALLVDALRGLRVVARGLDFEQGRAQLLQTLSAVLRALEGENPAVRAAAALCLAACARQALCPTMARVVQDVLPMLENANNVYARLGAVEAIENLLQELDLDVLPYIAFCVVPVMGRMSDFNYFVRQLATRCFARIVTLMPLEAGVDSPAEMGAELAARRVRDQAFLRQLLNPKDLDNFEVPREVKVTLRKYQQDGVNWLAFLAKYRLHGILCDDMGLGKTLQTICIIVGSKMDRAKAFAVNPGPDNVPLPSLVVCPSTLVGHWTNEFAKFAPSIRVLPYAGQPGARMLLRGQVAGADVVVTSYNVLRSDVEFFASEMVFDYCALDEGHVIKNGKSKVSQAVKQVQAEHRLILSGTPIQNNVLELWSLFDFLMPGFLGTERQFVDMYSKPITASKDPKGSARDKEAGAQALENLHRQVLPFLLRRLKEDVLDDLPPKIIQDCYCTLTPLQTQLYERLAQSVSGDKRIQEAAKAEGGKSAVNMLQALMLFRKLCSHPLFVLDENAALMETVASEHGVTRNDLLALDHAPKLLALQGLLHECGIGGGSGATDEATTGDAMPHRVLIFAQLKSMLDMIENELFRKHMPSVTYLRMDGKVEPSQRFSLVTKFNQDPTIDVMLLTTHVGGLGLNLTGADVVIFVEHDWNPMKDLQAMDRAHRIGQKRVVNVYRLITRNTIEEKIMGLQKFKVHIASSVVNEDNNAMASMNTNQVMDLFQLSGAPEGGAGAGAGAGAAGAAPDDDGDVQMAEAAAAGGGAGLGGALKILDKLGDLWDESQYQEEYNLDSFLADLA